MCVEELKNTELDESTENSCKCSDTDEEATVSEVAEEIVEEAAKSNETTEELKENGLGLYREDEGFYFAVKVDRYEFMRTLTTTVDY
jgi:hypothetical protein